jgi:hypothetical protein
LAPDDGGAAPQDDGAPDHGPDSGAQSTQPVRREVVIVDPSVADYQTLLDGLSPDVEVIVLGQNATLTDIAAALEGYSGIDGLHLISHGNVGALHFGGEVFTLNEVAGQLDTLSLIGSTLNEGGDFLLYGCYVGSDGTGRAFIEALATATGVDVAASSDLTGSSVLGGDWDLEQTVGEIGAQGVTGAFGASAYSSVLIPETISFEGLGFGESVDTNSTQFTQGLIRLTYSAANIFQDSNDGSGNSAGIFLGAFSGTETLTVQSTNGAEFDFQSFFVKEYAFDGTNNYSIQGFKDSVSQGTQQVSITGNTGSGATNNVTLNSTFDNVDRVVITSFSGGFFSVFDQFVISTPIIPSLAPTLTATGVNPTFTENGDRKSVV